MQFARLMRGRSLAECVEGRRDNILHLRLFAALLVIIGHCGLGGGSMRDVIHELLPHTYVAVLGLIIFFVISGFLITYSFDRNPHLLRFVRARVLRLCPALAVSAVLVAFALGPIMTSMSLRDYFDVARPDGPYRYLLGSLSLFFTTQVIDGVFDNPVSPLVNGPLWTIPVEATMYAWVAGAGFLRLFRFPWLTSLAIAGIFTVVLLWPMMAGAFDTLNTPLSLKGFFGFGAIAYLLRRYVPISTALMLVFATVCYFTRNTAHAIPITWLTIGYFVFWFSYVPCLPAIPGKLDLSYGMYLWGWPIQQTLVRLGLVGQPYKLLAITLIVVLPIALASWLWVEKPALVLKDFRWRRAQPAAQST